MGAGDPKLEPPNAGVLAPPPKMDWAGAGEAGCPNADVPNPPVVPVVALPKMFPLLVLALAPNADVPPNMEPPVAGPVATAGLAPTDPNSPPELGAAEAAPPKIPPVAAGVALAPNGLAVAPPPNIDPVDAPVATGDVAGVIDPNKPLPAVAGAVEAGVPNGEPPPKIDDPDPGAAALLLVTAPNRPVAGVAEGVTLPNAESGLASAEAPPKIEVVSAFGVEKAAVPKMLLEEAGLDVSGGVEGEQMLNEPNRFDVVSVVVVVDAGVAEGAGVAAVVVTDVVDTAVDDTGGTVEVVEVAVGGVLTSSFDSAFTASALTDKSVGLADVAAVALPNPNENPELAAVVVVAAAGLIDPNSVELVVVTFAEPLSTDVVVGAVPLPNETPAKSPPPAAADDVAGLILPKRPVPGAIVAVEDVPKIDVEEVVLATEPNRVGGFVVVDDASGFAGSIFWSRFVSAGKADFAGSGSAAAAAGSGSASFFGLSASGFTPGSFSFSLVRLRAGVVGGGCGTPNETGSLLAAPKAKVGLGAVAPPLLLDPNARTVGFGGSAVSWVFGMAWMVRPPVPNPYAGGGAAVESDFSFGF